MRLSAKNCPAIVVSLAASLFACGHDDKAGIVLRVSAESELLYARIDSLRVTVNGTAQVYQSTSLPGDLGIKTSPGVKDILIQGPADLPVAWWQGSAVAEAGKVVYYDVLLTAIAPGGRLDAGTDGASIIARDGAQDVVLASDHPADDSGAGHPDGPGGAPGIGGAGGASGPIGMGGAIGPGGAIGAGGVIGGSNPDSGAPGFGGMTNNGGAGPTGGLRTLGGATGSGGLPGVGGRTGSGGMSATGGTGVLGGVTGSGGVSGTGGMTAAAGAPGSGGTAIGSGGATGAGGATALGGSPGNRKFVGNIDTRGTVRSDFVTYWDQLTPANAGKWGAVQGGGQSSFNWSSLDAMYAYCMDHNLPFVEDNFIWGAQQPTWVSSLTAATGPLAVQTWMKSFCDRYPNTKVIEVVSEPPPHTTPLYVDAIGGTGSSGYDWIVNAFKWARDACGPSVTLILNDYNNMELSTDVQRTIDIVTAIQRAGAPIDAVGCEGHGTAAMASSTLTANIDKIAAATGLPIYISQYDLDIADDARQKTVMEDQFTAFWNDNNVKGITLWGYIVGATWVSNSGLMTDSGTMRPAMTWLMSFLGR